MNQRFNPERFLDLVENMHLKIRSGKVLPKIAADLKNLSAMLRFSLLLYVKFRIIAINWVPRNYLIGIDGWVQSIVPYYCMQANPQTNFDQNIAVRAQLPQFYGQFSRTEKKTEKLEKPPDVPNLLALPRT